MTKKSIVTLALAAAVGVGLAGAPTAPASAAAAVMTPEHYDDDWDRVWDFGNEDTCEAVGETGEAFGFWDDDEWYCDDDGTLYVAH